MVICKFYLKGHCRYGDRCWNEHPRDNASRRSPTSDASYGGFGGRSPLSDPASRDTNRSSGFQPSSQGNFNRGYSGTGMTQQYHSDYNKYKYESPEYRNTRLNQQNTGFGSLPTQNRFQALSSNSGVQSSNASSKGFTFNRTLDDIKRQENQRPPNIAAEEQTGIDLSALAFEMESWLKGGQWLFSCYSPFRSKALYPGLVDLSPEELRWKAYEAEKEGTFADYVVSAKQAALEYSDRINEIKQGRTSAKLTLAELREGKNEMASSSNPFFKEVPNTTPSAAAQNFRFSLDNLKSDSLSPMMQSSPFGIQPGPVGLPPVNVTMQPAHFPSSNQSAAVPFVRPSQHANFQDPRYTPMDDLDESDKNAYRASRFTLGQIPVNPPPVELCVWHLKLNMSE